MRPRWILGVLLATASAASTAQSSFPDFKTGELLVKYRPGAELFGWAATAAYNGKIFDGIPKLGVYRVELPKGKTIGEATDYFRSQPSVEFVEPNYIRHAFYMPNDPMFPQQWNLQKISAPTGWDVCRISTKVYIAIVDTGISTNQTDLTKVVLPGRDFVNNDFDPNDDNGHGTHCAGIAAGIGDNGIGTIGVGFGALLLPVKVLDSSGSGSDVNVANGIIWAADNRAKVISLSLGGPAYSQALQDAVIYAVNKGCVVVAAAGNSPTPNPQYPAFFEECIAVASTDVNDAISYFSTFGTWVDTAAPGENILSTLPNNAYGSYSGTSMAAPQVSGLAALLFAQLGTNSQVATIRSRIVGNCDLIAGVNGMGRINVRKALLNSGGVPVGGNPVNLVPTDYVPVYLEVNQGSVVSGSIPAFVYSDNQWLQIMSSSGSAKWMTFTNAVNNVNVRKVAVTFQGHATLAGTVVTVKMLNKFGWTWETVGTVVLPDTDATSTVTVNTNADRFVNGWGEFHVQLIAARPDGQTFRMDTNMVKFTVYNQTN